MIRFTIAALALFTRLCIASDNDADRAYEDGMRLAKAQRWDEARTAFKDGQKAAPRDKRFAIELAGVAYKTGDREQAITELHRALVIDPVDEYANEAIGSLYLLQGEIAACLSYWNRIGKPRVHDVLIEAPTADQINLRRAFEVSPGDVLTLGDFEQTAANLDRLGVAARKISLAPYDDQAYDVILNSASAGGPTSTITGRLISALSELPYQTVNLDFRTKAPWIQEIDTVVRWDSNKELAGVAVSGIVAGDPHFLYTVGVEGRNENWEIRDITSPFGFKMSTLGLNAGVEAGLTGRLRWTNGIAVSYAHFDYAPQNNPLFTNGIEIKQYSRVSYAAFNSPAKGLSITIEGNGSLGRQANLNKPFGTLGAGALTVWNSRSETHPWEIAHAVRVGAAAGDVPFNELYMLGMERDNPTDYWIRGHVGTYNGMKGNAPMGKDFGLSQMDALKTLYHGTFLRWQLGPFVDSGIVNGPYGSKGWMVDTGLESKLRILRAATLVVVCGHDLLHGDTLVYTAIRPK